MSFLWRLLVFCLALPLGGAEALRFSVEPRDQTVAPETEVVFEAQAAGGTSAISYQWFKNGFAIPNATGTRFSFRALDRGDEGRFKARATAGAEIVFSREAQLHVRERPAITIIAPKAGAILAQGGMHRMAASIVSPGGAVTNVSFYLADALVGSVTAEPYEITQALAGGDYVLRVAAWTEFGIGATSGPVSFRVQGGVPQIVRQPRARHVLVGRAVTLSAEATGPGTLRYQWTRDNVAIEGATSPSYTFTASSTAHAGEYRLVASNDAGSVTSEAARVRIEMEPPRLLKEFWHPQPARPVDAYNTMAYGNGMLVAGSHNGFIAVSADGSKWHDASPPDTRETINRIRFAEGKFWAACNFGLVLVSRDGLNWERQQTGVTTHLTDIAVSGGNVIAVGLGAKIARRWGAEPWAFLEYGGGSHMRAVAAGNGVFVALNTQGNLGYLRAIVTSNGQTLQVFDVGAADLLPELYFFNGLFVAVTQAGIFSSPNGQTWTSRLTGDYTTAVVTPTRMMAYGADGAVARSSDGLNWVVEAGTGTPARAVTHSGNLFYAVGQDQLGTFIAGSLDGLAWTPLASPLTYPTTTTAEFAGRYFFLTSPRELAWTIAGTGEAEWVNRQFWIVGFAFGEGTYYATAGDGVEQVYSEDGEFFRRGVASPTIFPSVYQDQEFLGIVNTWVFRWTRGSERVTQNLDAQLNGVAKANGVAVAVGSQGRIFRSFNRSPFQAVSSGSTSAEIQSVVFGDGKFVAAGWENGTAWLKYSYDGAEWFPAQKDFTKALFQVAYGDGLFMAASQGGGVAYSWDGITWEFAQLNTFKHLSSVAFGNGRWVVVGEGGLLMQTGRRFGATDPSVAIGMNGGGVLVSVGGPAGQLVRWEESDDLVNWTRGERMITGESPAARLIRTEATRKFIRVVAE